MLKSLYLGLFTVLISFTLNAQELEPENGVLSASQTYAFTNARIVVSADHTIERGTMVIKDGVIQSAGIAVLPPKGAIKIDLKGYTIYPSFIDIYATEGIAKQEFKKQGNAPQLSTLKKGPYYWNQSIHPETDAYTLYQEGLFKEKSTYQKQGFGAVSTHQRDGILRGTSVLKTIGNKKNEQSIIRSTSANHYSFSKGSSQQTYPSSQMGAIALIRQFFYDAQWYASLENSPTENVSLRRGLSNLELPQIFETSNKLEILRALKLAKEFDIDLIVKGGGDSYERIAEIKALGAKLIVPVNFPAPYDVTDPYLSRFVSLADLKDWEMRPYNAYILHKENVPFCFTSFGLKDKADFLKNIRKAVEHGLPANEALRALTASPAEYLNVTNEIGTLDKGKIANFLIVKGNLFEDGEIYENWIRGERNTYKDINQIDIRGSYDLNINNVIYGWKIEGTPEKPTAKISSYVWREDFLTGNRKMDTLKLSPTLKMNDHQISMSFLEKDGNYNGVLQLNGTYNPTLAVFHGKALLPNGDWVDWSCIRSEKHTDKKEKKKRNIDTTAVNRIYYPNMAYGFDSLPNAETFFIKNATIWTNEADGIIKDATLLIQDGKIKAVNKSIVQIPNGAKVIDAEGKHVTCGIVDEHSHIATSSVNEGGQNSSAEVTIEDVVNSDDINIYRNLAGGVTSIQILHGSANPIGGRSALIKLKWGETPDKLLIPNAPKFIKFALGENVKQSNWPSYSRFPQTRMGVEQVYMDYFTRAKEYDAKKKSGKPYRKDAELETIAEIINKERFISCHSYVQSEINMLMKVAERFNFNINTFTHILEGYKVADKMKAHGVGGSTFSDWWAYKYEVNDAIPYNGAIMHNAGVTVAFNSDDAEMSRRLNQEAAKAMAAGNKMGLTIKPKDAIRWITFNAAKSLGVEKEVGSLEKGKMADVVVWNQNPFSVYAKAQKVFIDGSLVFDIEQPDENSSSDFELGITDPEGERL